MSFAISVSSQKIDARGFHNSATFLRVTSFFSSIWFVFNIRCEVRFWCLFDLLALAQMFNTRDGLIRTKKTVVVKRTTELEWVRTRAAILDALGAFPGAREAVLEALVAQRAEDEGEGS